MSSGSPANPLFIWEDFNVANVAPEVYGEGLVATPNTIVNQVGLGHPDWVATHIAGTTNTTGCAASLMRLTTGTTSGNGCLVDSGGQTTASNLFTAAARAFNVSVNMVISGTITSQQVGFGLLSNATVRGTNWISDPNTTLVATNAMILYRDTAVASGAFQARLYDATSTDDATLTLVTTPVSGTTYKVEMAYSSLNWTFYVNGEYVGAIANPSNTGNNFHVGYGIITNSAAARTLTSDYLFIEIGQTSAR